MFDPTEKEKELAHKQNVVYYDRVKKVFYTLVYVDGEYPKKKRLNIDLD